MLSTYNTISHYLRVCATHHYYTKHFKKFLFFAILTVFPLLSFAQIRMDCSELVEASTEIGKSSLVLNVSGLRGKNASIKTSSENGVLWNSISGDGKVTISNLTKGSYSSTLYVSNSSEQVNCNSDLNNAVQEVQLRCSSTSPSATDAPGGILQVDISGLEGREAQLSISGPTRKAPISISADRKYKFTGLVKGRYEVSLSVSNDGDKLQYSCTSEIPPPEVVDFTTTEVLAVCEGDCETVGYDTDNCYVWLNEEGEPLEDQSFEQSVCPDDDEVILYFRETDNDGNIIQTLQYIINVLEQGNVNDIVDFFDDMGFYILPAIDIKVDGFTSNTGTHQKSSACNQVINHAEGSIIDLLDLRTREVLLTSADLFEEMESNFCGQPVDAYLTSNANFCDGSTIIQDIQDQFYNSDRVVIWYHVAEFSSVDPTSPDILTVGSNESIIVARNNEFKDITFSNWPDLFAHNQPTVLPPYDYSLVQRTFAPWVDFGALAVFSYAITKNNFAGDARGFSLLPHANDLQPGGATSRVYQKVDFTLDGSNAPLNSATSSTTEGWKNFIRDSENPCDYGCISRGGRPNPSQHRYISGNLFLQTDKNNPCIKTSPLLDIKSKFNFSIDEIQNRRYLTVVGFALNKGFPGQEVIIKDSEGRSVFLYTDGPPGEGSIFNELILPIYDGFHFINCSIEIDENGNFLNNLIIRELSGTALDALNAEFSGSVHVTYSPTTDVNSLSENNVVYTTSSTNIDNWNSFNEAKMPAGDCFNAPYTSCPGEHGLCN